MRKKLIVAAVVLGGVFAGGYWFFFHTVRGGSIALYAFGGWGAPLAVRYDCAKETDGRVARKFELPLQFDKASKDLLRGFWHYSYYRECLYRNGFAFNGTPIPQNSLVNDTDGMRYDDPYIGIRFRVPAGTMLAVRNVLDVDMDDRLFASELRVGERTVFVHAYAKYEDYPSFGVLAEELAHIPAEEGNIIFRTVMKAPGEIPVLRFVQDNGTSGLAFMGPLGGPVFVFSREPADEVLAGIVSSLALVPQN